MIENVNLIDSSNWISCSVIICIITGGRFPSCNNIPLEDKVKHHPHSNEDEQNNHHNRKKLRKERNC